MHHVALDRAGANDRHLNNDIVECPRFEPRQHRHLRPRFDLERAQRVGLADHGIGRGILGRHAGQVDADAAMFGQQIEPAPHAAQHPQPEDIDLHEPQCVDVVLVPLDHLPVRHAGRLDRHEVVQPVVSQHEPAGMLRQMPGKPDQRAREVQCQPQPAVFLVERQLRQIVPVPPMRHLRRQRTRHILRQPHCLADIAHRAPPAIPDHRGAQRGPVAAIGFVDPLDHFLPPLMLEIHIDIRRFLPRRADETFEQQARPGGIDRRDPQHVTNGGVRGRTPPLTQDLLRPCETHDAVHGQKIRRVFQGCDQRQLMVQLFHDFFRHASGKPPIRALPRQPFQRLL